MGCVMVDKPGKRLQVPCRRGPEVARGRSRARRAFEELDAAGDAGDDAGVRKALEALRATAVELRKLVK